MKRLTIDEEFLKRTLLELLHIHSPSGYTDQVVHYVGEKLHHLGIDYNVTRRGAIRATLSGRQDTCDRAILAHLDTLGAMVRKLKKNGRLAIAPVGTWPSRFGEGARVTVFTEQGSMRGTVLPLKSSGHAYGDAVNIQPADWDCLEVRIDRRVEDKKDLLEMVFKWVILWLLIRCRKSHPTVLSMHAIWTTRQVWPHCWLLQRLWFHQRSNYRWIVTLFLPYLKKSDQAHRRQYMVMLPKWWLSTMHQWRRTECMRIWGYNWNDGSDRPF